MKVAILHDYLNQLGGAERVVEALLRIFPDADIYTLLHDPLKTQGKFVDRVVGTSILDVPLIRKRHRLFIPFMPLVTELMCSRTKYDLVLSSSAGYGKGIPVQGSVHISYCHTPLRYAWEFSYLHNLPFAPWPLKQFVFQPLAHMLRAWDKASTKRVDTFLANSSFIANKIKNYYERSTEVVYPPVNTEQFYPDGEPGSYYLMVGRLLYYKLFQVGIGAAMKLDRPLKVVGSGPEGSRLRAQAGPQVEFIPYVDDDELRRLYSGARAVIFPQTEDFGLVAAEAQACGTPVIGYHEGGISEIVEDEKTGLLVSAQTVDAFTEALKRFEAMHMDRRYIAMRAKRFSHTAFDRKMRDIIRRHGFEV